MILTKVKVFLSNHLPDWAFKIAVRLYHRALTILSRVSARSKTRHALYLKVAQRTLSTSDRKDLAISPHSDLIAWNRAFELFETPMPRGRIDLGWVHKPIGGNFGDWLSPYLIRQAGGMAVRHVNLSAARDRPHVISLGSVISYATRHSTVIGAGINSMKDCVDPAARFLMVRGHITREALPLTVRASDIPCCDPGFFIRNVYKPKEDAEFRGGSLLIPHLNHWDLFASIEAQDFRVLSAAACQPEELERLVDRIAGAREVVTTAMHVFVMCCAFGIPCALIKPKTAPVPVPGDGIKYRDCMSPVMREDFMPQFIHVRPGTRLRDEVHIKEQRIDFLYIDKMFLEFKDALLSARLP